MKEQKTIGRICTGILLVLVVITLLPIALLVLASFTEEKEILTSGYTLFPKNWSLDAYAYMIKQGATIFRAYGISILVTIVGTVFSVLITTMLAYPMSRKNFKYRKILAFFVFFTMLFNGGLVPTYLMYTGIFHINNTLLAYIVPGLLMSAMNVMLIRTFFATSIPDALFEAAQIDGASQFQIFFKIVLPLGKPILIAMGLLSGLGYWNDWTNGLYYIRDTKLYGIQNLLNKMISDLTALTQNASGASTVAIADIPSASVRMAIAFVAMLPILCLYPFLQRYFTKGIALGAVKG